MALSADRNTSYSERKILSVPVAEATRIFAGSLVCANANGYAVPADDDAALLFWGVADNQADNRLGDDGDIEVIVRREYRELFDYQGELSQAALGACVYAVDDETVSAETDHDVLVGVIARVNTDGKVWVDIRPPCRAWEAPTTTTEEVSTTTAAGEMTTTTEEATTTTEEATTTTQGV